MKQRLVMGVAVVVVVFLGLTWTTAQDSAQTARIWDADHHEFIAYACTRVFRDLTPEERQRYGIAPDAPATCPQFATEQNPAPILAPTWTPIPTQPIPVWTPIASPTP